MFPAGGRENRLSSVFCLRPMSGQREVMKRKAVLIVLLVVAPGLFAQGAGRLADLTAELRRIEADRRRLPARRK